MVALAVDDETLALDNLCRTIGEAVPDCEVCGFSSCEQGLAFADANHVDIAFLDIEMCGMTGIELALQLKKINPKTNIVFVTAHLAYAASAFSLHASGYLFKPVTTKDIVGEIEHLRYPVRQESKNRVRIQCFGNFEMFVDNKPFSFPRSKSKELLAYLIDRKGAGVTSAEICAVLWEDKEYNRSMQKQTQTVISLLMRSLKQNGVQHIINKSWNSISVDAQAVDCDYFDFLQGKPMSLNAYTGEYMRNYSWAEFTLGNLNVKKI